MFLECEHPAPSIFNYTVVLVLSCIYVLVTCTVFSECIKKNFTGTHFRRGSFGTNIIPVNCLYQLIKTIFVICYTNYKAGSNVALWLLVRYWNNWWLMWYWMNQFSCLQVLSCRYNFIGYKLLIWIIQEKCSKAALPLIDLDTNKVFCNQIRHSGIILLVIGLLLDLQNLVIKH